MKRKLYPPKSVWSEMRKARLEEVGYICEMCSAPDAEEHFNPQKPHPFYPQGTPYRSYLQFAHRSHYERWNREASGVVVCARCHGIMDEKLRRKAASYNYAPIGVVIVWVYYKGSRYVAAEARRFDDVCECVMAFDIGMRFELCPEAMLSAIGKGVYCRTVEGIEVVKETGACRDFGLYLQGMIEMARMKEDAESS